MNRTQRRQMEKMARKVQVNAKRRAAAAGLETPAMLRAELPPLPRNPEEVDHEVRNSARTLGLVIPPSPAERQFLEKKGHQVPQTSGLYLP